MIIKNTILGLILFLAINSLNSQSYGGLLTDNYSGTHGVISNPANIADSRLKLDVNLLGISAFFGNNYIGFNLSDAFSDFSKAFDNAATFPSNDNFLTWNIDLLGPSVMLSINEEQSFSVFTRVRSIFNIYDVNGELLAKEGGFDEREDFFINQGNVNGSVNFWGEIGISYARVLMNDGKNFIKGGLTLKYIQGMGNVYVNGTGVALDYDSTNREITTTGQLSYGNSDNLDDTGRGVITRTGKWRELPDNFRISAQFERSKDANAALSMLQNLKYDNGNYIVAQDDIAILGFSDGASAAISTLMDTDRVPDGYKWTQSENSKEYDASDGVLPPQPKPENGFAGGVFYYGGSVGYNYWGKHPCSSEAIESNVFFPYAPMLYNIPENGYLTENTLCLVDVLVKKGAQIELNLYNGVGHGFDFDDVSQSVNARNNTIIWLKDLWVDK